MQQPITAPRRQTALPMQLTVLGEQAALQSMTD